ncbi:MAG: site-specific integrase [Thermoanaerobacter sp.]|nr:site-specific integrase [Thermoanaerobacter sp.]
MAGKKKRRGHGEGSISKRPDGRWMAQAVIGHDPATGKLKRITKYFRTRQEAQDWLAQVRTEMVTGTFVEPARVTVGEWVDKWLNVYARQRVDITSYGLYETLVRCHIKPSLGGIELQKLRPIDIQQMYAEKLRNGRLDGKGGLSAETVTRIYNILHSALKQAMKEGLVTRNVAEAVDLPKIPKKEVKPLAREAVEKFLEAARKDRLYALFVMAIGTGLRRGELLGLKWEDINFEKGTLSVRRTLARAKVEGGPTRTALVLKEPKTGKSRRLVVLANFVLQALKAHKARQAQEKLFFGQAYQDEGLVFCTEEGKPIDPRNFTRRYTKLMKDAGLEHTRFHNWRHTFATLLLEMGEHPKVVQEMLGHSKIAITLDTYSHLVPGLMEQAAEKLDAVFGQKKSPSAKGGKK